MNSISILFIISMLNYSVESHGDYNDSSGRERSQVLSRRKRFLIFPEGSSFQLVFCNTFPILTPVGDIFLYGYTSALAWELPQDPYSPFHHHADPLHRRQDTKMIYYTSEEGKIIYKRPYSRSKKLIVNPAFAKRSVDSDIKKGAETKQRIQIDKKLMHASQSKRDFLNNTGSSHSLAFHRSARASLYQKIEAMLNGNGADGKQCMLKTLCVVEKTRHSTQGTFLQEILRATFTIPEGHLNDDLEQYNASFSAEKSCDELYSDCQETLTESLFGSQVKELKV